MAWPDSAVRITAALASDPGSGRPRIALAVFAGTAPPTTAVRGAEGPELGILAREGGITLLDPDPAGQDGEDDKAGDQGISHGMPQGPRSP